MGMTSEQRNEPPKLGGEVHRYRNNVGTRVLKLDGTVTAVFDGDGKLWHVAPSRQDTAALAAAIAERDRELRELRTGEGGPWLVVICREGDCEVTAFEDETEATEFFDRASVQWSDSYLCRAVRWPRDVHARTGAGTAARC